MPKHTLWMTNMFLNGYMLFGSAAVGVPILIHLLNRRKFERVVWAAMRFLRVSVEQNQRRIQIEDIFLLILRCALLLLLAVALARPALRSSAASLFGSSKVTAVIVLDNSYSMSLTDGEESRFASAKKAADRVLEGLPNGSSAAVLLASDTVIDPISEPTFDLTLASNTIRSAPLVDRSTNLYEGIKRAIDTLKGRPTLGKEIYLITDGQAIGWRQMEAIRKLLDENKKEIQAHLLFVGKTEDRNLGVSSLRLPKGICPVNSLVDVEVRVKNYGKTEARDVNVRIAVDDDPSMAQTIIASIPPGEERSAILFARFRSEGFHSLNARIDADHLPADDFRSVAVRVVKDISVLLIDGDTGRELRDSEVFFLKHALRPVPRSEWDDYYIKLSVRTPTELENTKFDEFAVVIAANVTDFSPTVLAQLDSYVRSGRSLVVFPGDNINRGYYNEQLYRKSGLLPAMLGEARGDAKTQDKWFSLADKAGEHEITSIWRDANAGTLSSAKFFKVYDLLIDEKAPAANRKSSLDFGTRVIARFSDNKPAIVEKSVGQGCVVLFPSSADTAWNDLPVRAGIFIPLMQRTLGYMVARQDQHLTIRVGEEFVHHTGLGLLNRDVMVTKRVRPYVEAAQRQAFASDTKAKDCELNESQRIEMVDGVPTFAFKQTHYAGTYEAKAGETLLARFAAQPDPEESSMEMLSAEQYKALGEMSHVVKWSPGASLVDTINEGRVGTEFWMQLVIAAIVLASLETAAAQWFSKSK